MVTIYALDSSNLPDPKEDKTLFAQLSKRRQERINACTKLEGRKELAGASLLLSYVLMPYGYSEDDFIYGWNGKPELLIREKHANSSKNMMKMANVDSEEQKDAMVDFTEGKCLYFNLSHSENMVILAVSDQEVGCDIEKIELADREKRKEACVSTRDAKIARRFFTEREQKAVEEGGPETFYRIWTRKESYIKMTGEGMKVPFLSLETCPELSKSLSEEEKSCVKPFSKPLESISEPADRFLPDQGIAREGKLQTCYFKEYVLPGYQITVCGLENSFVDEILFQEWETLFPPK